jgi:hypothetical protein
MGVRITNKNQIGLFFFFRFQVASRKLHQSQNEIYQNTIRLQIKDTFATVWIDKMKQEIQLGIYFTDSFQINPK